MIYKLLVVDDQNKDLALSITPIPVLGFTTIEKADTYRLKLIDTINKIKSAISLGNEEEICKEYESLPHRLLVADIMSIVDHKIYIVDLEII